MFNHYAAGVDLKPLTANQINEAKTYWRNLTGKSIDTRWHQLLYSKTGIFKPQYMPFEIYSAMISKQIPPYLVKSYFDDKCLYKYLLRDFNLPRRIVECCNGIYYLPEDGITEVPFSLVIDKCFNLEDCIIKPSKGSSSGNGVRLLNTKEGKVIGSNQSIKELLSSYKGNFVIEKKIKESDSLSCLNPSSCNTLRIHTWRNSHKECCEYISSYVRIGREGSVKDNASGGGITCQIMPDGRLGDYPCTVNPYKTIEKTDSGVCLPGYEISYFKEMVSTAVRAHSCLPLFGIIGWDICVDSDGRVVIIEFNPDPDMRIEQLVFRDSCLLDKQEEIIKEIFEREP